MPGIAVRVGLIALAVLVGVSLVSGAAGDSASSKATKRRLVLHGPNGARLVLEEMPLEQDVMDLGTDLPRRQHILRSGTCARAGKGVASYVSAWGPIEAYDFDTYRRATFALESRDPGVSAPAFCVEHRGPIDLKFTSPRPHTVIRAKRLPTGVLVAQGTHGVIEVEVRASPVRRADTTRIRISSDEGGSGGTVAYLRRGSCRVRPSSAVIALGVIPNTVLVELPFESFGRRRWVVEVLGSIFGGSAIKQCVEL